MRRVALFLGVVLLLMVLASCQNNQPNEAVTTLPAIDTTAETTTAETTPEETTPEKTTPEETTPEEMTPAVTEPDFENLPDDDGTKRY